MQTIANVLEIVQTDAKATSGSSAIKSLQISIINDKAHLRPF